MPKALWNGVIIAESDATEIIEGNHYFPPTSIHRQYFRESEHHTVCGWKGTASYYDVVVEEVTEKFSDIESVSKRIFQCKKTQKYLVKRFPTNT